MDETAAKLAGLARELGLARFTVNAEAVFQLVIFFFDSCMVRGSQDTCRQDRDFLVLAQEVHGGKGRFRSDWSSDQEIRLLFQDQLLDLMKTVLPKNAYAATRDTIEDIIRHQRGGLLSLGFLFALYFTTNAFMALMRSFNTSYHLQEKRSALKQRLVAINLTFILSTILIVATTLIVFSEKFTILLVKKHFLKTHAQITFLHTGNFIIVVALFLTAISFLYYYAPAVHRKFRFISPGSLFATIAAVTTSVGFAYFVNNFGKYNKVYGSIGTLIVIMMWIYINSLILLLGFELNASINQAHKDAPK